MKNAKSLSLHPVLMVILDLYRRQKNSFRQPILLQSFLYMISMERSLNLRVIFFSGNLFNVYVEESIFAIVFLTEHILSQRYEKPSAFLVFLLLTLNMYLFDGKCRSITQETSLDNLSGNYQQKNYCFNHLIEFSRYIAFLPLVCV